MTKWKKDERRFAAPADIEDGQMTATVTRIWEESFREFDSDDYEDRRLIQVAELSKPIKVPPSCETALANAFGDDTDQAIGAIVTLKVKGWTTADGSQAEMIMVIPKAVPTAEGQALAKLKASQSADPDADDVVPF